MTDFFVDQVGASLKLSWLPSDNGGCPTNYEVQAFDPSGSRVLYAGTSQPDATAPGLRGSTQYTFQVTPSNRAGRGPTSRVAATTRALCLSGGMPGLVTGLAARPLGPDGRVELRWGAPRNNVCAREYLVFRAGEYNRNSWRRVTPASPDQGASYM